MYVSNRARRSVSAIDTGGQSVTIPNVGFGPSGIAYNDDNGRMYVTTASGYNYNLLIDVNRGFNR
jgi:DNA-binding beta-propeller fold protein YncE